MKNYFFLISALILIFAFSSMEDVNAQDAPEPYVMMVEYTIDEANIDKVVDLLSELQLQTLENEEGCVVFDVLLGEEDASKIFIYESYESHEAYKKHTNSPYYKKIVPQKLKALIKEEKITKVFPLNFEPGFSE